MNEIKFEFVVNQWYVEKSWGFAQIQGDDTFSSMPFQEQYKLYHKPNWNLVGWLLVKEVFWVWLDGKFKIIPKLKKQI